MKKLTPAQQQYVDLKNEHKDALLFFRMGDFYEVFYDDAKIAHDVLGITLTARDKKGTNPIPMAGVPHHSLEKYTSKLLKSGYKVAVAEQISAPTPGKIVERKVVQILTPGTVVGDSDLSNYIVSVCYTDAYVLAWGDVSLGTYMTHICQTQKQLLDYLLHIAPSEVVLAISMPEYESIEEQLLHEDIIVSIYDIPHDPGIYIQDILSISTLDGYGISLDGGRKHALALLFSYVSTMQHREIQVVHSIQAVKEKDVVLFDDITRDNLEIFTARYDGSRAHSLFDVINTTKTAMGARLLHDRLAHPTRKKKFLEERLGYIEKYLDDSSLREKILSYLAGLVDIQRLCTQLISGTPSPLRVQHLLLILQNIFTGSDKDLLQKEMMFVGYTPTSYDEVMNVYTMLEKTITTEPIEGGMYYILPGCDEEVDKYRQLVFHADDILLQYQQQLQEHAVGVKVKLKRINNQGYLLEVTPKDINAFEQYADTTNEKFDFIRMQTLKTGQRYTTPYLRALETKIVDAKHHLMQKETILLSGCIEYIAKHIDACIDMGHAFARIDVAASFAAFTHIQGRCIPQIHDGTDMHVVGGRHPVVEHFLPTHEEFIPNDFSIDETYFFHLITGPNMGGKSTYLRQQALILLLSHAGLSVPASSATIPLIDALFARIGAGDALAKNQSTFMTEMLETANILHNATDRSYIFLDELGRGTSTYDGLALAKSITVYICQNIKAKTLFATHYHELTSLEDEGVGVKNYQVSVYENQQDVVFLKKVVAGKASKSYGIDVAQLAGIPQDIITQAKKYLTVYESSAITPTQPGFDFGEIDDLYRRKYNDIQALCEQIDINAITPIEALVMLQKIKQELGE